MINGLSFRMPPTLGMIKEMKAQMGTLQVQLASGKRAQTLSQLGGQRVFDFALRGRLSDIESYRSSITMVNLRVEFMSQTMTRLDEIEATARSSAQLGSFDLNGQNFTAAQTGARDSMNEVLDLLNLELNGRYLFAGTNTANKPVKTFDEIMNGSLSQAGFKTVSAERRAADLGADNMGRTSVSLSGSTVTFAEDGAHPFGIKLASVSAESGNLTLSQPSGSPASLSIEFSGQPNVDEHIQIAVNLPNGNREIIEMRAVASSEAGAKNFVIGSTTAETAANFEVALEAKILEFSETKLIAASGFAAADNFFAKNGDDVLRVDGPPETATALVVGTEADTIMWYTGDNLASNVRQSVGSKVDAGTQVSYGVQGNEDGMVRLVRALAAFSLEPVDSSDPSSVGRYEALNDGVRERLSESNNGESGSLEGIIIELGMAMTTLNNTSTRHTQNEMTLQTMLGEIEDINPEEVAMQMLTLRTRLEASYQATSMISQLSLVNYL